MNFLERDLEEIIKTTPNHLLQARGLEIRGKKLTQVRIGNYGILDLITIQRPDYRKDHGKLGVITIYELKKDKVSVSSFFQALGYVKGVKRWLTKHKLLQGYDFQIRIVLVGKNVDRDSSVIYLPDVFKEVSLFEYGYDYDGIMFSKLNEFQLTNEGF